jgi:hypothetical protein
MAEYRDGRELAADAAAADARIAAGPLVSVSEAGLPLPPQSPTIFVNADSVVVDDTRARVTWAPERRPLQGAVVARRELIERAGTTDVAVDGLVQTLRSIGDADPDGQGEGKERPVLVVPTPEVPFSLLARVLNTSVNANFEGVYVAVGTPDGPRAVRLSIVEILDGAVAPAHEGLCTFLWVGVGASTLDLHTVVVSLTGGRSPKISRANPIDFVASTCRRVARDRASIAAALPEPKGCVQAMVNADPGTTWAVLAPIWAQLQAAASPGGVGLQFVELSNLGNCPSG